MSFLTPGTTGRRTRLAFAGVLASLAMVAASCGSDADQAENDSAAEENAAEENAAEENGAEENAVEITGAWARTSPVTADRGAAYMELRSIGGDRLVSASVDATIAGSVEIHETVPVESDPDDGQMDDGQMGDGEMDDGDSVAMDQAMTMRELPDGLELPAGEVVALAPGGLHLMFLDLPQPFVAGESFELALDFEKAGTRTVTVEILDAAP